MGTGWKPDRSRPSNIRSNYGERPSYPVDRPNMKERYPSPRPERPHPRPEQPEPDPESPSYTEPVQPTTVERSGSKWDKIYSKHSDVLEHFSLGYQALKPVFDANVNSKTGVAIVGCGISSLGADMAADGYKKIANFDYSTVCIQRMKQKYNDNPELTYTRLDLRHTPFTPPSFNVVIDKGTLDSMIKDCKGSLLEELIINYLYKIHSALNTNGVFFLITENHLKSYLIRGETPRSPNNIFDWTVKTQVGTDYKIYIITKNDGSVPLSKERH